MKLNLKVLGSLTAVTTLVLAFQNCSPVNFGTDEKPATKNGASAPPIVGDPDDGPDLVPPITNIDPDYDYADNSINNPTVPPRSGDMYRAMCASAVPSGEAVQLKAGMNIEGNHQGDGGKFKASRLGTITGNAGSEMIVLNDDTGAGTIQSIFGNNNRVIVVCGFSIKLAGGGGPIVLVNSHVETLSGNGGNVTAIDTTIKTDSGNGGVLTYRTLE